MECMSEAGPGPGDRAHLEWDWTPTRGQCQGGTQNSEVEHGCYKQHSSSHSFNVL